MILFIAGLLTKFFGVDLQKAQRAVVIAFIVIGLVLILIFGLWMKSCFTKTPKLNEAEIQKGEQAVKERNDAALKEILVQSDVREAQIEANVSNARAETVNAIAEAKEKYANMNTSQLAEELERRK